jgi:hypothetical protein
VRPAVVVQAPELIVHDLDGNLVRDGRWMYGWDAENRLVRVMSWGGVDLRRVDWTYDAMGGSDTAGAVRLDQRHVAGGGGSEAGE